MTDEPTAFDTRDAALKAVAYCRCTQLMGAVNTAFRAGDTTKHGRLLQELAEATIDLAAVGAPPGAPRPTIAHGLAALRECQRLFGEVP